MTPSSNSSTLSEADIFDVLSDPRRRHVVRVLERQGGAVSLDTLARRVAAAENDIRLEAVSYHQRKRVYTALQQGHLPTMDDCGVIAFDSDRGIITPTDGLADVERYLSAVHGDGRSWDNYSAIASTVAVATITAAWIGAWPFSLLAWFHWTVVLLVLFVATATVQTGALPRVDLE
ncbi:DUF7344 domain-containing protein [Halopiger xanaduensis]|uniref:DUF7344 domain-containing protein n=1 Tax=Halopiger xanaduensis (strain DSM 18323 / JCM 14033 / SH-6) TaxID=797210 RepID=F8DBT7_HALXS|nr:hypothetical protein Halxa_4164 [Halopiger xanaduensis SH-6]